MKKISLGVGLFLGLALVAGAAFAAVNFKYARESAKVVYQVGDPVTVALSVTNTTSTDQTYSVEAFLYGFCPGVVDANGVLTGQGSVTLPVDGFPQSITVSAGQVATLSARTIAPSLNQSCQVSNPWTLLSFVHAADGSVQANTSVGISVIGQ